MRSPKQLSRSRRLPIRYCAFVCTICIVLLQSTPGIAQWKQLAQFDGKQIDCIYFMAEEGAPNRGGLGLHDNITHAAEFYFSVDTGHTWSLAHFPRHIRSYNFTFKDSLNGWAGTFNTPWAYDSLWFTHFDALLRTTDGGATWSIPSGIATHGYTPLSLALPCYNKHTGALILSAVYQSGRYPWISYDDGINWTSLVFLPHPALPTYAIPSFSTAANGVVPPGSKGGSCVYFTDGGKNPDSMKLSSTFERGPVRLRAKTCRACPLYGSSTFVAVVSGHRFPAINVDTSFVDTSFVIRTTDGGDTWDSVGNFPKDVRAFLYAEGDATNLFCETNLGVWVSNDTGSNWRPICGPSRFVEPGAEDTIQLSYLTTPSDTTTFQQHYPADLSSPLYFHDSRLFVADGTGGLWQLDTASLAPRLSLSEAAVAFDATPCTPKDTAVILTGEDFCQALPVTRLSASIEGSAAFLLDTIHRIGAVSDTVHIRYAPSIGSHDSARVHLRYSIGNRIIDTTIRVVGTSIFEPQPIVFAGQFREQSVPLGVTATLDISGNQTVSGKGLTQIAFDLLYNTDLLELTEASSSIAGTTVSADPIYVGGGTRQTGVHLSVRGNELTLDSELSYLKLDFRTYITDTLATSAVITNLHLNNGDPSFERCVLQASGSGASVSVTGACSDSILSQYLRVRSLVLAAIHPNPATDEIYLDCYSPTDADVRVELFGATGSQLYSTMRQLRAGWNSIRVSTTGIPSGTNTVRMSNLRTVRTEKFIIQR